MKVKPMAKKEYKSALHSRNEIRKALLQLLAEGRDIDDITIKELSERAGVTRGTFYNHYRSIEMVTADIEKQVVAMLLPPFKEMASKDLIDKSYFSKLTRLITQYKEFAAAFARFFPSQFWKEAIGELDKATLQMLQEGRPELYNDPDFVCKFLAIINGYLINIGRSLVLNGGQDIEQVNQSACDLYMMLFASVDNK